MKKNNSHGGTKHSRRGFIIRAGLGGIGVLAVGVYVFRNPLRRKLYTFLEDGTPPYMGNKKDPIIWFELTEVNRLILHSPKVEMGQGTFTGLAQMTSDELRFPLKNIDVIHAASSTGNIDGFGTGGSSSIASLWLPLRELAAGMREMIKSAAGKKWNIEPSEIKAENGLLYYGDLKMTYAKAAEGVTKWKIPRNPELTKKENFISIGKPVPRVDLEPKVYGAPIFGMDSEMPDMLHGAVVRPTKIGAKFVSADISKALQMPGVIKIVEEEDFVGVIANSYQEAHNAKDAIKVEWLVDRNWSTQDIEAMISVGNGTDYEVQKHGGVLEESKEHVISSTFRSPLGSHAQIEPNGAVAYVDGDKAIIKLSTQVIALTRKEVSRRLGIKEENVEIIPTFLGGGFGRRLFTPHAVHTAILSKAVGRPVKCFFTRKEEFQHDMFRPPTHHVLKGLLDEQGNIAYLEHQFASGDVAYNSPLVPGILNKIFGADIGAIRGGFIQYDGIPNVRAVSWHTSLPFSTSWWRGLGLLANTFAIESFMDELAESAGRNAVEFRLSHINDRGFGPSLKRVIREAAEKADYSEKVMEGSAMGFAVSIDSGTPCAQIAEVTIENGEIKVKKVTCVLDPGLSVNPDQVRAQCEGSIIMGISATLYEKMSVENGELQPTIYGPYQMALMRDAPREIDVILLSGSDIPKPVGEPPIGPIGAAIANAVYRLTGKRLRELPLKLA